MCVVCSSFRPEHGPLVLVVSYSFLFRLRLLLKRPEHVLARTNNCSGNDELRLRQLPSSAVLELHNPLADLLCYLRRLRLKLVDFPFAFASHH